MQAGDKHRKGLESYNAGRFEEAAGLLSEALQERESSELWNDWATALFLNHRPAEAEAGYRRALQLDSRNAEAATNLGALLVGGARPLEALRCLERLSDQAEVVESLRVLCREALAKQRRGNAPVERLEPHLARAVSTQSGAVASLLLRTMALKNAVTALAPAQPKAGAHPPKLIPTIPAAEILPDSEAVELSALDSTEENVTLYELCLIVRLCRMQRPRTIFEIGTADGRTTMNLAVAAGDAQAFTLDIGRPRVGARFQDSPVGSRITQLIGDSASFDFSPFFNSIDFVFIDANHNYEYIRRDSHMALRLLRGGQGTMVWHDYIGHWPGVMRALNELFASQPALAGMNHIAGTSLVCAKVSNGFAVG